jgi:Ca2+-transporting ATPase
LAKRPTKKAGHAFKEISISWHALSPEEVIDRLESTAQTGLSSAEVEERRQEFGYNQLDEAPRPTFLKMVFDQLNNFLVILLIVAAVISALLGDYTESIAILAIVILNAVLGVIQESRAEESLAALKRLAAPEAQVLRDGHRIEIPARQLVPGDIVFLEAGNYVPADIRLLEAVNLRIEEAALTGESQPVEKNASAQLKEDIPLGDRTNTAFMGTLISYGRGHGVVVNTGMKTQLGMIATMLQAVEVEETPLQRRLDQLGKVLGWAALAICGLVFSIGITRLFLAEGAVSLASAVSRKGLVDMFMIAISLAIAAVPEGLPAVVTISLALGMNEMVKRHVLIRRLASVETLGSATVICSDKTGTLTQNEMTVTRLWVDGQFLEVTGTGYFPKGEFRINGKPVNLKDYPAAESALWVGILNNDAHLEQSGESAAQATYLLVGDPTEGALLVAAAKAGALVNPLMAAYPRADEIPFDSIRKRMVTLHTIKDARDEDISPIYGDDKRQLYAITVKGAPDEILKLCSRFQAINDREIHSLTDERRRIIMHATDAMSQDALRVLGLAYRLLPTPPLDTDSSEELEKDLVFVGLVGMIDPARPAVHPALLKARQAHIRTVMITGDYPNTARAVAESIGLLLPGHKVLSGAEINALDDAAMRTEVARTDVYARVSPEHKLRIVDALRDNGEVVAMTGDGVNDAPAIKRADIGVAMGITGTDVAKETADMVLTDDNYASIVSAVEQGRIIYANIRKFVFFLLSSNLAEIMIIFLATLAGLPTPLTAIQLLWLNLLTDGAPALALAMEKGDPDVMQQPPYPKKESIINKTMQLGIIIQTITQTGAVLTAFCLGLAWHLQNQGLVQGNTLLYLLRYDWRGVDAHTAETMAFITLVLCELFRAYTVRSERVSLFRLGVFSNKWMQAAVGFSIVLLMVVVFVPFFQPIFNTHPLNLTEWGVVLGLALVPAITEEITKTFIRTRSRQIESATA